MWSLGSREETCDLGASDQTQALNRCELLPSLSVGGKLRARDRRRWQSEPPSARPVGTSPSTTAIREAVSALRPAAETVDTTRASRGWDPGIGLPVGGKLERATFTVHRGAATEEMTSFVSGGFVNVNVAPKGRCRRWRSAP